MDAKSCVFLVNSTSRDVAALTDAVLLRVTGSRNGAVLTRKKPLIPFAACVDVDVRSAHASISIAR